MCEWKGKACYWSIAANGQRADRAAWSYPNAYEPYAAIRGWFCFYPSRVACYVNDKRVRAQPGDFYGGWITAEVKGPFKGDPGSGHW